MERILTCIECPRGCTLTVFFEGGEVTVSGNFCSKGEIYGKNEVICPRRTVTGTVRAGDKLIPVKTDGAVRKDLMFDVMEKIRAFRLLTNVKIGDIIIENVDGEGANLVAASPYSRGE